MGHGWDADKRRWGEDGERLLMIVECAEKNLFFLCDLCSFFCAYPFGAASSLRFELKILYASLCPLWIKILLGGLYLAGLSEFSAGSGILPEGFLWHRNEPSCLCKPDSLLVVRQVFQKAG